MARSTSMSALLRAAVLVALASQAVAQTCYYANGKEADQAEKPCSTAEGSACCPDTWECLDNGLCYNPAARLYGRYSCTDKTWGAAGCPSNMCIYGALGGSGTIGAEGIAQCSNHNNQWCCNGDRTNVNCCQESPSPRPFFQLQDGRAYATIGRNQASTVPTLSSITGLVSGSASANAASSTAQGSSSGTTARGSSASRAQSSATPVTSEVQVVSSGSAGLVTITQTVVSTPSVAAGGGTSTDSSSGGGSGSNIGLIVGCAVGIPLALAMFGIIFWMLRKRRNQKKSAYKETPEMDADSTGSAFAGGAGAKLGKKDVYRHSRPGTSEIDSNPVGPGRPVSNIPGHAELDSGAGFQPGHGAAYGPDTVGIGGGNGDGRATWGSPPPNYSPGMNQAGFAHPPAAELDATSAALPVINEKPQQYQAYRPPQNAAELPTVKTPPEDVEKQLQR